MEKLFRGQVLDFIANPTTEVNPANFMRYYADGAIIVSEDGFIADMGCYEDLQEKYPQSEYIDYSGMLIMPGFIDTHIHYSQTPIIASYGKQLLDWLNDYTYPVEEKFSSPEYARKIADDFIYELLKNGTTTCVAFTTENKIAANALFEAASKVNMRIISGKVLMDRNAPDSILDSPDKAYQESKELIEAWHKKGRNLYAVTPRFAITCDMEELKVAGWLHREYPDTYLQTHLSENPDEVKQTMELFPECTDYLNVYETADMLTDRTIFAHGIYLSDSEIQRISSAGAIISHCPTSNLFLGSGLYRMQRSNDNGVKTAIGSDVGAGTTFSLLQTLNEAYKVQQLNGYAMTSFESFYKLTLGAAKALQLDDKIGSFAIGNEADFVVIDYQAQYLQKLRMNYLIANKQWNIETLLFGLQIMGDDRNIIETYIMGNKTRR